MTHRAWLAAALLSTASLTACMSELDGTEDSSSTDQDVAGATTYMSIMDFPKIDQGAWYDAVSKLNSEFAASCGDTFCGGDYANLTPLTFGCAVSSKEGTVHACSWTFTASQVAVDPKTAALETNVPTFVCPITAKTSAVKLLQLLQNAPDALHATIPGAATINEQLAGCFDKPIGATPITVGTTTPASYVAASDYYSQAGSRAKWAASQKALLDGFNNICGDTFCSSDYNDIQSLDFECSVTKSTGNIKSCAWVFGGSFYGADQKTGAVDESTKSFRCNVAVKGTLPALITTLTGAAVAGSPGPIDRPLPGMTTSAYDALGGCLP